MTGPAQDDTGHRETASGIGAPNVEPAGVRHVVMFSGGIGSWAAAKRVAASVGTDNLTLLFADTLIEDADLYRFLEEGAANVGGQLVRVADGRTPWEVFRDRRFLGNSQKAQCSLELKQKVCDAWLAEHCDPSRTVVYLGMDWTEEERFTGDTDAAIAEKRAFGKPVRLGARRRYAALGWTSAAPLCDAPFVAKGEALELLRAEGIEPPRLYTLGFAHNNCGGGCVRAGIGHFTHLYRTLPDVYAEWERNEQGLREFLERDDIAILRDRTGGTAKPLTLVQLRRRLDAGHTPDLFDIGGCGCFVDSEAA